VLRDGTVIVGIGLLAGLLVSTVATRALQSLLFAVTAHDPFTLVAAAAALVAATLLGCYLPARRAAKVQPARTLAE
jgi:putative ABC transport system permease protein